MGYNDRDEHLFMGKIVRETDMAILFHEESTGEEMWLPESQVSEITVSENAGEFNTEISIPEWLAIDKGLI